jgi:mannose-6-phosphate isomerase-like protein (cupin superfamily)
MRLMMLGLAAVGAVMLGGAGPVMPSSTTAATIITQAEQDALIADARARANGQPNVSTPIVRLPEGAVNIETRTIAGPAAVHPTDAEIFYVLAGSGELTTGGTFVPGSAPGVTPVTQASIKGGVSQPVSKGQFLVVPANLPHAFTKSDGQLAVMSLHLVKPAPAPAAPARP